MNGMPRYPKPKTLNGRTLALLGKAAGEGITHRTLDGHARSYRLSGYIHSLKFLGWQIEAKLERVGVVGDGYRAVNIARYWLSDSHWVLLTQSGIGKQFLEGVRQFEGARAGGNQTRGTAQSRKQHDEFTTNAGGEK